MCWALVGPIVNLLQSTPPLDGSYFLILEISELAALIRSITVHILYHTPYISTTRSTFGTRTGTIDVGPAKTCLPCPAASALKCSAKELPRLGDVGDKFSRIGSQAYSTVH